MLHPVDAMRVINEIRPQVASCCPIPFRSQYARMLAQRMPLVAGLQAGGCTKIVVRLRPGANCAVRWRMSHLLCPVGANIGSIAQVREW